MELECECVAAAAAAFLALFEGESVKRGSHECEWVSASEPSVDVDQRERSVRSGSAPMDSVEGERRIGVGLWVTGLHWESLWTKVTSMSKSNDESGDAGADESVAWE